MKLFVLMVTWFFTIHTFQLNAQNFCEKKLQNNPYQFSSRLAFGNHGGLKNGGVCWWHSRLQRAAFYLTSFNPNLPKPDKKELKNILRKLRYMTAMVEIPGFKNFHEFSKFYINEIQTVLEKWQISDGFLYFQWIRGISGTSNVNSRSYLNRMNKMYHEIKNSDYINWTMLQLPGIEAHAYLILSMDKISENKYRFKVVDSNEPLDTTVITTDDKPALYLGFHSDIKKIKSIHQKYCGKK